MTQTKETTTAGDLKESAAVKVTAAKKTAQPSIFARITAPYREWRNLPNEIHSISEKSQRNLIVLLEMLIDYRLSLMKAVFTNEKSNLEIWNEFHQIKYTHEKMSEGSSMISFLKGLKNLRRIYAGWQDLIARQTRLLEQIIKAPASLKYYNFQLTYLEMRKQERASEELNERRFSEAYNALELALGYVKDFASKRENASKILDFNNAIQFWSDKIAETSELEKSGRMNFDDLFKKMDLLKNTIFEAPPMAKWIIGVEERFARLMNDHNLLVNAYNKPLIHAEELEETGNILSDVIPRLWLNGENAPLERYIKQVETFVNTMEPAVSEELAYQERHRPWSSNGDALKDADELTMLTSFVGIMINAIEARESHMGDHSATVARLAELTARELEWSDQEIRYLKIAGLLHDVGKIWIPDSLLIKSGPLTDNEIQVLRMHPYYSAKIVASIKALKDIVPWVLNHHERWDGKGYPDGLKGNEIPLGASIIAVAEAFSSMIFNRLMREPLTFDQAIAEVRTGSSRQFDPDVTEQFITAATSIREELEERQKKGFTSLLI